MDELDYTDEQAEALDPNIRKQLKEAKKARRELEEARAELEAQKRELQFTRAGIADSGLGSLFRKAYDGPADADSIRKAAEEYGILQPVSAAPAEVDNSHAELEALRARLRHGQPGQRGDCEWRDGPGFQERSVHAILPC